jgi:hypothetical protein
MHKQLSIPLKRAFAGLMLALTLAALGPASAQQSTSGLQSYDVELIIFRHLAPSGTEETWMLESVTGKPIEIPDEDASPFDTGAQASASGTSTQTFPALATSKFQLTAIEDALRRSRNYKPLAHIGWTQPGFARNSAPFLSLNSFVPASSGVTGQIALSRGRYLHLTLDLTYTNPESGALGGEYVLRQSRRMRSNERHYIDHPKFGVIALVTPSSG